MREDHCERHNSIEIGVATHKKMEISLPPDYFPIQVNCYNTREHWAGYFYDDEGDNISEKNPSYSELTALYWLWRNSHADIKGLVHYRRFFSRCDKLDHRITRYCDADELGNNLLDSRQIEQYLVDEGYDILLIMPQRPYPNTGREELLQFVYEKDLNVLEDVIRSAYPDYVEAMDVVLAARHLSYFNMMIAGAEMFGDYCAWLFDVLEATETRIDISGYDAQHKRIFGYFAEVLLNVYLEKHSLKRKYFILLQTVQDRGADAVTGREIVRKGACVDLLQRLHLRKALVLYQKCFHKDAYAQYVSTKSYLRELSARDMM